MDARHRPFFFAIASCYLIFSLAPVAAYQVGDFFNTADGVRLSIEPVLKIIDDIRPVECDSTGAVTFRAYVDNVGEFDITGREALIEDVYTGVYYDVTDALTCAPETKAISNQEITCSLNIGSLLAKLPKCPLDSIENRLYVSFDISHSNMKSKVTDSTSLVVVGADIEPVMEADFAVSQPPYPVPEINCMTGSEIDVPVIIRHAEKLFDDIQWSFAANGTASDMVECSRLMTRSGEGREDIYICTLTVSGAFFTRCEEGIETTVQVRAKSGEYNLAGEFSTTLTSQELQFGMTISGLDAVECQLVSEEGLCIPLDPQRNVTVTITGNVPERLKVFEARYAIGGDNTSTLLCTKLSASRYQCMTFVPMAMLPPPSLKNQTTARTMEMAVFFDVKYLNYYASITAEKAFEMQGTSLDELINTLNVLNKDKKFFEAIEKVGKFLSKVYSWIETLNQCCLLQKMLEQMTKGKLKDVLKDVAKMYLWGPAQNWWEKTIAVLIGNGPAMVSCIAGEAMKDIGKEMQNLEDFEDEKITAPVDVPDFDKILADKYPECRAKNFWDQIKNSWKGWLCALIFWTTGIGETVCPIMASPAASAITQAINALLTVISALLLINTFNEAMKNIVLARERMNLQLAAANAMTDYTGKLGRTMESLAASLSVNTAILNITNPSYGTVKLIFVSERTGVLSSGDSVCSNDMIAIDYDFEKLNQTEGFEATLFIQSPSRSKTLHFDQLKGTYGPYATDSLLGTDPATDKSELYTLTLSYGYGNKKLDYQLNYVNHPCSS